MAIYYGRDAISCHSVIAADCTNVGVTPNKGIKIRLSLGVNFRLSFRVGSNPVKDAAKRTVELLVGGKHRHIGGIYSSDESLGSHALDPNQEGIYFGITHNNCNVQDRQREQMSD